MKYIVKKSSTVIVIKKKNDFNIKETENIKSEFSKDEKIINMCTNTDFLDSLVFNFQIKDNEANFKFSKRIDMFRKYVMKILRKSETYKNMIDCIDTIVYIMDRIVYITNDQERNDISETIEKLDNLVYIIEIDGEGKDECLKLLFDLIEWWLLKILQILDIKNNSTENNVDEIFDNIIDIKKRNSSNDFVETLFKSAKETYTCIKQKDIFGLSLKSNVALISEVIVCLIFPMYINMPALQEISAGKRIGDIGIEDTRSLIESIKNEYFSHLQFFRGREKEIVNIIESIITFKYTIIKGQKGIGKSALISGAMNRFSNEKFNIDFSPLIVIFSFSQSKSIPEMVSAIVEQCNLNLINKIDTETLDSLVKENVQQSIGNMSEKEKVLSSKYEIFKVYISESLKRVTKECGKLYLVIDSLELVEQQEDKLAFLLDDVPNDCHLILSTGEKDESVKWITNNVNLRTNSIHVKCFERNEIPLISGLDDETETNRSINDRIFEITKDQATYIRKVVAQSEDGTSKHITDILNEIKKDDIDTFEVDAELYIDNNLLEETLLLLAVFEPIQSISLEYIQLFLSYKNLSYRMPKIRNELRKIDSQISNLRFNRIKLISGEFASFVLKKYYSSRDIEEFICSVFKWLSLSFDISLDFICEFIKYMEKSELISREKFDQNINIFINNIIEFGNNTRLFDLGLFIFLESESEIDLALKFIDKASKISNTKAKSFLGYIYLKGKKVNKDIIKAEKLLREASDMKDIQAKIILSLMLFDGADLDKDIQEGQKLLEEAILLGSKDAKLDLALRLIFGKDIKADINKGQQLLAELAEDEHVGALYVMGQYCLFGGGVKRDVEKGKKLLIKAIDKGNKTAQFSLARYLITAAESQDDISIGINYLVELIEKNYIDAKKYYSEILIVGIGGKKDINQGIKLLKELVDDGDEESTFEYAKMLIEGIFIPQNVDQGKEILNKLVKAKNIDALSYLGDLLIDGEHYDKDIDNGMNLLIEAANSGDLLSTRRLALRFIYGFGTSKNFEEGERLLKQAISKGDVSAKYQYARVLLNKKDRSEKDIARALDLLKNATYLGSLRAKRYLGILLLDGEIVQRDIEKGLEYLNEAICLGSVEAMTELGYRLIFGIVLQKNSHKGENLLRKAIDLGDDLAKTILAHSSILGESHTCDLTSGIELLEEAAKVEINAMRILGNLLLKGIHITKNKQRGEELLRVSSQKGDDIASLQLADMLLDGSFLNKNIEEGREILEKLVRDEDEAAIIDLSNRLINGDGFDKDVNKGLELLQRLSQKDNLDGKCQYAHKLISGGDKIVKNIKEGEQLLREVEERGHEDSRRLLAKYLINGVLQEKEENEGLKFLEKAVIENDFLAMTYLGDLLLEGIYVEKDVDRALQLYEKSILGTNHECKVSYAMRLLKGYMIPKNKERGVKLLEDAVCKGNLRARYELAQLFIDGEIIEKNTEKGLQILNDLIEDGYNRAKCFLAKVLMYGDRVEKDTKRSIELFEELVKDEYVPGIIEYAELLIEGMYIPKNSNKGELLLKHVSQKGEVDATYLLATRYLKRDGLKRQVKNGRSKLIKAANSLPMAMLDYGIRLKKGIKVSKNETMGGEYIDKAIKKADTDDLFNLGVGAYQLEDFELATQLLIKAYENGDGEAGTSLAYMLRRNELRSETKSFNIFNLLETGLSNSNSTSIINLVLSLIKDETSEDEWRKADLIVKRLDNCLRAAKWWYDIADKNDDVEGHLIIGWLSKYNKIQDPSGLNYKERLNKVVKKGWFIPEWMFDDNDSKPTEIVKTGETAINLYKSS